MGRHLKVIAVKVHTSPQPGSSGSARA